MEKSAFHPEGSKGSKGPKGTTGNTNGNDRDSCSYCGKGGTWVRECRKELHDGGGRETHAGKENDYVPHHPARAAAGNRGLISVDE